MTMACELPETAARSQLRADLEAQRAEMTEQLKRRITKLRESGADTPSQREPDEGDPWSLDAHLLEIAAATIRRIDVAIERLDSGAYGLCHKCRGSIGEGRLRAMPFAVYCHACEAAREDEGAHARYPLRSRLWSPSVESDGLYRGSF